VKWFGGLNKSTGRENHYGFIEADGVDFFVHRKSVLSPKDLMIEGAEVLFQRLEDRSVESKIFEFGQVRGIFRVRERAVACLCRSAIRGAFWGAVLMGRPGVSGRSCDLFRAFNGPEPVLRFLTQPERR
jgi:hypothetical protein